MVNAWWQTSSCEELLQYSHLTYRYLLGTTLKVGKILDHQKAMGVGMQDLCQNYSADLLHALQQLIHALKLPFYKIAISVSTECFQRAN